MPSKPSEDIFNQYLFQTCLLFKQRYMARIMKTIGILKLKWDVSKNIKYITRKMYKRKAHNNWWIFPFLVNNKTINTTKKTLTNFSYDIIFFVCPGPPFFTPIGLHSYPQSWASRADCHPLLLLTFFLCVFCIYDLLLIVDYFSKNQWLRWSN